MSIRINVHIWSLSLTNFIHCINQFDLLLLFLYLFDDITITVVVVIVILLWTLEEKESADRITE